MRSLVLAEQGESERDVIALRIATAVPDARELDRSWPSDAGWLARKGATIVAIGTTTGSLRSGAGRVQVRGPKATILTSLKMQDFRGETGIASPRREHALLQGFADQLALLSSPLVVTCGGRGRDLPLLRYRCLAQLVPLEVLHLSIGNRWKYFDRFDSAWHLDVADLLAGYGASSELNLDDLTRLGALDFRRRNTDHPECISDESNAIFGLFLKFLLLTSWMDKRDYEVAMAELSEVASGKSCKSPLSERGMPRRARASNPDV